MLKIHALLLCAIYGAGCGEAPVAVTAGPSRQHGGLIIGANDLLQVSAAGRNVPARYRALLDAFGLLSMGCTATHVGDGLALSAGHCFGAPRSRAALGCAGVAVYWGYRGGEAPHLESRCLEVLAAEVDEDRDYALFRVSPAPAAMIPLELAARPPEGSALTMFGHPEARPLEWSRLCTLADGPAHGFGAAHFAHRCDSQPGSSGSAVLDDASLRIVGIHDGGAASWNYATYALDAELGEMLASPGLGGFELSQQNAAAEFRLPEGTPAGSGTVVVVARDAPRADFEAFWQVSLPERCIFIDSAGEFPRINGGESFSLRDPAGRVVDEWLGEPVAAATPGYAEVSGSSPVLSEAADPAGAGAWRFEFVEVAVP